MNGCSRHSAVGLFGGTFDPVHQGHLELARHVLNHCRLDQVLFIPAPQPPHKWRPRVSFADRVAMIEAALADTGEGARMSCSCLEADLPFPSYTVQTVEALQKTRPDCAYSFIIGGDSLVDLPNWYRANDLLARVNLIVVYRDTLASEAIGPILQSLDPSFRFDAQLGLWCNHQGRMVRYLDDLELPVSSSLVRECLARGEVPSMLPPAVFDYIRQHHLYGWQEP
ncbi:MAG: nicotinate (nicotinamide) nucleotide adenylyltransferase [Desulfobulbus sp.]|nr:nicotinate (nicotinamide) nucleotide adenylyltransferase [Desulfobulbus sp.]